MVNSWLMFAGIGMILVGALPILWWWRKKRTSLKYFIFGAAVWFVAILIKLLMDITLTPLLTNYLQSYGTLAIAVSLGFYVGLRTGLFESGFTYIAGVKTKLKHVTFDEAVAFGLGFGGIEAILLGLQSFLNILVFALMPTLLNQLPEGQQAVAQHQLNQSTWIVFAPIIERIATIVIHVFAAVLVFLSIHSFEKRYLVYSVGFKSLVDGIIPALTVYVGSSTLLSTYLMELPILGLGLVAAGGVLWVKDKWRNLDAKGNDSVE
ncbi:MAG TPA: YhfC family intramembrane metalloprotease [Thermoplasmatales archaeon]|nr:YhfC family intramembrane metalloprotease [Thermoplasmatales archaeon]